MISFREGQTHLCQLSQVWRLKVSENKSLLSEIVSSFHLTAFDPATSGWVRFIGEKCQRSHTHTRCNLEYNGWCLCLSSLVHEV